MSSNYFYSQLENVDLQGKWWLKMFLILILSRTLLSCLIMRCICLTLPHFLAKYNNITFRQSRNAKELVQKQSFKLV